MARAAALLVALGLAALTATAAAEPIKVGPAALALDPAWTGGAPATTGSPLVVRRHGAALLTVTRAAAPNTDAWRARTRERYLDEVEAGLVAGAVKLRARRTRLGADGVPVLDVTLRRAGPVGAEVVAVRMLLFRTVTIAAAAAAPDDRRGRKLVEAAVAGLAPAR